ncbi:hypothetical protein LMG8323_03367 [Ralstonia mannitolilytica]|nr:hypothetical protein LMG8323_03367 [Ralstonia mannitolilytica]
MARHLIRRVAHEALCRLDELHVGERVVGQYRHGVRQLRARLQLQASRTDLAARLVVDLPDRPRCHVFLIQVEHRRRQHRARSLRLIPDTGLELLGCRRLQQVALLVCPQAGVEAVGIAEVRGDPVVEQVDHARALGELRPAPLRGRARAKQIRCLGVVFAYAQREAPAVDGNLVLQVQAGLLEPAVDRCCADTCQARIAVHGVEGVDRVCAAGLPEAIHMALLVIQAEQHRMPDRAGREFAFELIVDGIGVRRLLGAGVVARQLVGAGPAEAIDLAQARVAEHITEVLAHRPLVIERVLELIADHALGAAELLDRRVAIEEVPRDEAAVAREDTAFRRHAAVVAAFRVMLQVGLQQQVRVGREVDCQRRRNGEALLAHVLELRVHAARYACHTKGHHAVLVDGAGDVERAFEAIPVAHRDFHLVIRLKQRLLAGQRHHPARRRAAIENRARPFEHIDALQKIRIDLERAIAALVAHQAQAVEQGVVDAAVIEAAQRHVVVTVGCPHQGRERTRRVVQRLRQAARLLVIQLLLRDHRNRLRRLDDGRVGLGAGRALFGNEALAGALRRLAAAHGRCRRQRRGNFGGRTLRHDLHRQHCPQQRRACQPRGEHHGAQRRMASRFRWKNRCVDVLWHDVLEDA